MEDWRRPAESTSLRAGSGGSWPMLSEAKEMELNIVIVQFDQKQKKARGNMWCTGDDDIFPISPF